MKRLWILRIGLGLALVALVTLVALSGPVRAVFQGLLGYLEDVGPWGAAVIIGAFAVSTVLLIPTPLLSLGAGFIYGPVAGLAVAMTGITLGAVTAQVSGRLVAGCLARSPGLRSPKWARVVEGVDEGGFRLLVLLRMSSLFPYTWMNYAIAMTRASLSANAAATFLGMLPMIALQVYLASLARDLTEALEGGGGVGWTEVAVLGLGAVISIAVILHVARVTRRKLG